MMIFVRKKKYEEICGAMLGLSKVVDALSLDLVRERKWRADQEEMNRKLTEEGKKAFEEIQIERRRADQFQARCEAYEDATHNAGFEFVRVPGGFALEHSAIPRTSASTFWERLNAWPR